MAKRNLKSVIVRMPSTLKRRLAREVARRESTLNDVAVDLLADEFGVDFQPSGRRGPVPGDTGVVLLRMPPELKRQLDAAGPRPIPATLFVTGARGFNLPIADAVFAQMTGHGHPGLTVIRAEYGTSHVGADLPAFEEALERFFTP